MSTTVVPAPVSRAKRPVNGNAPKKQAEQQQAVNEDEARLALGDSEIEAEAAEKGEAEAASVQSETSLGEFTFGAALAEAAASSSLLAQKAEDADSAGFGQVGDGDGSTVLLIGAIALVALGVVVLVGDGGDKNGAPTITAPAAATTAEDTAVTIAAPATTDPDGDAVTVTATATNGTIVKNANGSFTFTPAANFNGTGVITYTASDGALSATATQNVTITAVDDPPVAAAAASLAVTEDTPATGTAGITDVDGPALTFAVGTQGSKGTVTLGTGAAFTYTPNPNANGTDTFTIVGSNSGGSATQTFNVTIAAVNDAPDLGPDQTFTISENTALTGTLVATDVDGDPLTYGITTAPAATTGTLTVAAGGALNFTPATDFVGTTSFVVNVSDGAGGTDTLTITVVVEDTPAVQGIVIDNVTGTLQVSGAGGDFNFLDNVTVRTDAVISAFSAGDQIIVTHPTNAGFNPRTAYFYTASALPGVGTEAAEIIISYNAGGNFTQIVLVDAAVNANGGTNFVFDYASAVESTGFDFINVGDAPPPPPPPPPPTPGEPVVIDNATGTLTLDAAGDDFDFLDNVTIRTSAEITNFAAGDKIVVDNPSNAAFDARTAYFFTASNTTGGPVEEIIISYNAGGNFTQIVLVDAAINADGGANFVFDYASAVASMGFDFITIA